MIFSFSLYGFLKNQRYYEPFFLLAFVEKGLDFFAIGLLIAFREVMSNCFEIPSGAIADLYGRRFSMIFSFTSYIFSFILFGACSNIYFLMLGMLLFALADAFRTGTHKAMIFEWLKAEGRQKEKTKVYGITRSWSKYGSAFSVLISTFILFIVPKYSAIFYLTTIPYALGIINFCKYPAYLDGPCRTNGTRTKLMTHLKTSFCESFGNIKIRQLILESMCYEGFFTAIKDYLQPILKLLSLGAGAMLLQQFSTEFSEKQQVAIFVGPVYFILFICSGFASRLSNVLSEKCGSEENLADALWKVNGFIYFIFLGLSLWGKTQFLVPLFVFLYIAQNVWRPALISRFDNCSIDGGGATLLSIESQASAFATMIFAPLMGFAIDFSTQHTPNSPFWPIGIAGVVISLLQVIISHKRKI